MHVRYCQGFDALGRFDSLAADSRRGSLTSQRSAVSELSARTLAFCPYCQTSLDGLTGYEVTLHTDICETRTEEHGSPDEQALADSAESSMAVMPEDYTDLLAGASKRRASVAVLGGDGTIPQEIYAEIEENVEPRGDHALTAGMNESAHYSSTPATVLDGESANEQGKFVFAIMRPTITLGVHSQLRTTSKSLCFGRQSPD